MMSSYSAFISCKTNRFHFTTRLLVIGHRCHEDVVITSVKLCDGRRHNGGPSLPGGPRVA